MFTKLFFYFQFNVFTKLFITKIFKKTLNKFNLKLQNYALLFLFNKVNAPSPARSEDAASVVSKPPTDNSSNNSLAGLLPLKHIHQYCYSIYIWILDISLLQKGIMGIKSPLTMEMFIKGNFLN